MASFIRRAIHWDRLLRPSTGVLKELVLITVLKGSPALLGNLRSELPFRTLSKEERDNRLVKVFQEELRGSKDVLGESKKRKIED
jgi:hypothetical protein